VLARLSEWRECRLRGSLSLEEAARWSFGICRVKYDEAKAPPRFMDPSTWYVVVMGARWASVITG